MTTWRTSKQKKEQVEPYDWYWVREVTGAEKRGGGYLGLLEEPWPSQAGASIFKCLHVQWVAGLPERDNYKERRGPALPYLPRNLQNAHFQLSWLPHNMWDMSTQAQVSPMQKPQCRNPKDMQVMFAQARVSPMQNETARDPKETQVCRENGWRTWGLSAEERQSPWTWALRKTSASKYG